ncbi:MAG: FAD-dependent oxidoreductase [Chromatiales bacterium]|nr:FAD-dependent oxidoreductase [Chromatiales bacterium]
MSDVFPSHASVVVIGGGAMGCSTLYHLATGGVGDAILLERNQLTSGTTWHSAAQVRALRSSRNLTDLIRYSIELYTSLEARTGQATGWISKGSLSIATNPDRLTHIARQASLARAFGLRARTIEPGEAKERWPLMNADDVIGAVWSPDDGRVSPSDLCAALARGARAAGARIFEDTAVTGIATRGGRVVAVETARGTVRCDAVALCTGLWSRRAASWAGVGAPVWPCEHFYLLTRPVPGAEHHLPTLSDHDGHLYIRDESQGLLVGCFEPMGKPLDPDSLGEDFAFRLLPEDWEHFEPMMANALHRLPVLETAEVRMLLNGPESFTPDGAFLLGEAAETRGLFLGCGMNSVGVASAGGAGMALAHGIVHGHLPADLREVDPARFPDCLQSVAALTERIPEILGRHYEIAYPARQPTTARHLRRGPLDERHRAAHAHLAQVYGFERPLYFGCTGEPTPTFGRPVWFDAVAEEVGHAHRGAAVFDLSTFGKIAVEGPDAERFLDRVCTNDMRRPSGCAIYTAMLNPRGGFESDLVALRLDHERYRLHVGTAAIRRDLAWLRRHLDADERVRITDVTEAYAVLGLMGPAADRIATELGATGLPARAYRHAEAMIAGIDVHAARISYVGEPGWELTCAADDAVALHDALCGAGARPAGLLAQTAMRIEKRRLAIGHDLDGEVTPIEAGLERAVEWSRDFVGRDALLRRRESGACSHMVTLVLDDLTAVPLGNEPVYHDDVLVGQTTSAAFGHRVGRPLALAYLSSTVLPSPDGAAVTIDIAGEAAHAVARLAPAL